MTIDELAAKMDKRFESLDQKMDGRFEGLEQRMNQGFNDSKIRDEELLRLTRFGLEADEVVSDSINRRLDESNRKHDESISLLKDVIRHHVTKP